MTFWLCISLLLNRKIKVKDTSKILTLQSDLRRWEDMPEMINFVKNGGFWTKETLEVYSAKNKLERTSPLITISVFEDGLEYNHDGHHRLCSIILAGRSLRDDEYTINQWKYSDYIEFVPENNWYTPFDPRTHIRTADFGLFKKEAKERFKKDPKAAREWVYENSHLFKTERTIKYVTDLANLFFEKTK